MKLTKTDTKVLIKEITNQKKPNQKLKKAAKSYKFAKVLTKSHIMCEKIINKLKDLKTTVPGIVQLALGILITVKVFQFSADEQQTIVSSIDLLFGSVIGLFTSIKGLIDMFFRNSDEEIQEAVKKSLNK